MQLRVMLVERSTLVRSGLQRILEAEPNITVVAQAGDRREALQALARREVDVVVICATLDREACRPSAIASFQQATEIGIVCVSHWTPPLDVEAAFNAGALACVEMLSGLEADLREAVRQAANGHRYVSPGLRASTPVDGSSLHADYERLTVREREVLVMIARGLSNREIARELAVSANTVAVHRNHIMKKIGVRKATGLALFAAERGLLARK